MSKIGLLGCLMCFSSLCAVPSVAPDPIKCIKDLELNFFDPYIVNSALSMYDIREELWPLINEMLKRKSFSVLDRMKRKTAYMVPNPIEYPLQPEAAAKVLLDVLREVFLETLNFYYIDRQPRADFIFNYIALQQQPKISACFGQAAIPKQSPLFENNNSLM